ncbi:WecB/TagA/CpsF family glycosyltransferase [Corallincola spongiicola]|uniref:WecB/TagA/CpsF family glycosyltransferase n=1 Tax=Corallincola spongiicola TaxID=2520508 RepID=A0ABY1WKB1_9GAMM|nr:WecB/TagA/CpsF family glycosyltransferase [Corallincola spongiicola]TAA39595.1 WecB/TagA/CpsF family glycosyltransferase [Corallincola spongiicola]
METIDVGGIPVGLYSSKDEVVSELLKSLGEGEAPTAIAINPEKVISAKEDEGVLRILLSADVRYADGIGVVKVLKRKNAGSKSINRIPGCELWETLMEESGIRDIPVYLVGARPDVLDKTCSKLKEQYSTPIVGATDGFYSDEVTVISQIKNSGAKIVTVAMGSPKQESFIAKCKGNGVSAIFMGVGGTYDVYTGTVLRAPELARKWGLEWFYRLSLQPKRVFRQTKLFKFVWLYILRQL